MQTDSLLCSINCYAEESCANSYSKSCEGFVGEEVGWVDVVVWDGLGVDELVVVLVAVLIRSKI
jgi:hypothetical protein